MRIIILALLFSFFGCQQAEEKKPIGANLAIGTYTNSGSHGIYLAHFDSASGMLSLVDSIKADNPSYLTFSANGGYLYAVAENAVDKPGAVDIWQYQQDSGKWLASGSWPSLGDHPCYVSIAPDGKLLAMANYTGGSLGTYVLDDKGLPADSGMMLQRYGTGPNADRQEKAHVHTALFDGRHQRLWIADLGTDRIVGYAYNGKLNTYDSIEIKTPPGSGPRHIAIHPTLDLLYAVHELTGEVSVWPIGKEIFVSKPIQVLKTDTISPNPGSADIHFSHDGKFLYVSNRMQANNITAMAVDANGSLTTIQHIPTGGETPRNFMITLDDKWLLAANQNGNNVVVFKRNPATGQLIETSNTLKLPKPVCLVQIPGR